MARMTTVFPLCRVAPAKMAKSAIVAIGGVGLLVRIAATMLTADTWSPTTVAQAGVTSLNPTCFLFVV